MGVKDLLRKRISPEELKTKLMLSEKKLEKRENQLKDKKNEARGDAKHSLKNGDERGFRIASRRYGMVHGQVQAISSMAEMATSMRDMVEMQEGLKEVVSIGSELKRYQEKLGINSKQLEQAVTNVRVSMEKLNTASEMIATTMDAITAGSAEATKAQEELKKELMAEIETEGVKEEELEKKIKAEES
jgi:hypothetical protein